MVRADLVPQDKLIQGEATTVKCVHGDNVLYPLAEVVVQVEGVEVTVKAAVFEQLPVSVLLGTDVPELGQLLHSNPITVHTSGIEHALVTTRAQARRLAEEDKQQREKESVVQTTQLNVQDGEVELVEGSGGLGDGGKVLVGDKSGGLGDGDEVSVGDRSGSLGDGGEVSVGEGSGGFDVEGTSAGEGGKGGGLDVEGNSGVTIGGTFADDLFEMPVEKRRLTKKQKREERRGYGLERAKDRRGAQRFQQSEKLLEPTEELRQLQEADESLKGISNCVGLFKRDGIMYR